MIKGKHSRFSRHLQRVGGSKVLAELIVFTGRVDAAELRDVLDRQQQHASEAPQLDGEDRAELKKAVMLAKFNLRTGKYFSRGRPDSVGRPQHSSKTSAAAGSSK